MTRLERWRACIKAPGHAALFDMLDSDAMFENPTLHTPQRGRDIDFRYRANAGKVFGGPEFSCVDEMLAKVG